MKLKTLSLILLCLMQVANFSLAEAATEEKEDDIRLLIVLMGNDNIAEQMAEMMVTGVLNRGKGV